MNKCNRCGKEYERNHDTEIYVYTGMCKDCDVKKCNAYLGITNGD